MDGFVYRSWYEYVLLKDKDRVRLFCKKLNLFSKIVQNNGKWATFVTFFSHIDTAMLCFKPKLSIEIPHFVRMQTTI